MGTTRALGPGFRALFLGSLVSNTGDGIRLAALPLLAATLTSSPLLISAVTAAQYLPWVTFAPLGGVVVDRRDRRATILSTQTWRALVMAGLAWLVWDGHVTVWHVCLVAFAITVGEILVDPSTVALVPTLVGDADLERANGRIAGVEIVTNDFAGGPVGAAAFALAPWLPFLVDGISYLGSVLAFRRLPKRTTPRPLDGPAALTGSPLRSVRADAAEGFRWLRRHPVLGPLTLGQVVYYFGSSAGFSLLVVLVTDELAASAAAFGAVLAAGAAGAFAGSLVGSRLATTHGPRVTLTGAVALQGATLACAALSRSVWILALVWFANGVPAGVQRPVARSLQQRLTPNHLLGRVNVSARIFTRGVIVVGALCAGALAEATDVRWSFGAGGMVVLGAAVVMWRALARLAPAAATPP